MLKLILDWTNKPFTLADFIGVAFVTALVTMVRDIALIEPDPED